MHSKSITDETVAIGTAKELSHKMMRKHILKEMQKGCFQLLELRFLGPQNSA